MSTSTLRMVDGSVVMTIPESVLKRLGLGADARVGLSVVDGRLVVDPRPKPRYRLEDLVAECDPDAPATDEDRDWTSGPASGREEI